MKVVALVSGGKDSCHAMYLATREGHEVVALANLLPQELQPDELDSYMFQTVRAMCWVVGSDGFNARPCAAQEGGLAGLGHACH